MCVAKIISLKWNSFPWVSVINHRTSHRRWRPANLQLLSGAQSAPPAAAASKDNLRETVCQPNLSSLFFCPPSLPALAQRGGPTVIPATSGFEELQLSTNGSSTNTSLIIANPSPSITFPRLAFCLLASCSSLQLIAFLGPDYHCSH